MPKPEVDIFMQIAFDLESELFKPVFRSKVIAIGKIASEIHLGIGIHINIGKQPLFRFGNNASVGQMITGLPLLRHEHAGHHKK
jgi:hypothetical protein